MTTQSLLRAAGRTPTAPVSSDIRGYLRAWTDSTGRNSASAIVIEASSERESSHILSGVFDSGRKFGSSTFDVPGVSDARGYVVDRRINRGRWATEVAFRRATLTFIVTAYANAPRLGFARTLAAGQSARAPNGESLPADKADEAGQVVGAGLAAFAVYLLLAAGFARVRTGSSTKNPPAATPAAPEQGDSARIEDVDAQVREAKPAARATFWLQVTGAVLVTTLLARSLWPDSLALALIGAVMLCVAFVLRRRAFGPDRKSIRAGYRRVFTGRRLVRVVGLLALTLIVAAAGLLVFDVAVVNGTGGARAFVAPVCLVLAAIAYRRARRNAALDAADLHRRDPRAPILYLRSFGDDRLKIIARRDSARHSGLERFGSGGADRFEEVVAGHLWRFGPVVAVSDPGESPLPPLGAARTHLDDATWQREVATRMQDASLIVIALGRTPGLGWEVTKITEFDLWSKTLVIFPPVDARELRERWDIFRHIAAQSGMEFLLPADAARTLVLARDGGAIVAYTGSRRDEWYYEAALEAAATAAGAVAGFAPATPEGAAASL